MLINIGHISVHISSDGLFSTCFLCPTSADEWACVFRGGMGVVPHLDLNPDGTVVFVFVCVGACECVCVCVCACT